MGAFLMVLFYGLATHTDYLHYSTELLPTLLLMVGFYIFLVWLDDLPDAVPAHTVSLVLRRPGARHRAMV